MVSRSEDLSLLDTEEQLQIDIQTRSGLGDAPVLRHSAQSDLAQGRFQQPPVRKLPPGGSWSPRLAWSCSQLLVVQFWSSLRELSASARPNGVAEMVGGGDRPGGVAFGLLTYVLGRIRLIEGEQVSLTAVDAPSGDGGR